MISEREGFLIPYKSTSELEHRGKKIFPIDSRLMKKGYTNLSRGASGHANFVNWKAVYRSQSESHKNEWVLQLGDGSKRIYSKFVKLEKEHQKRMNFPTRHAYLLTEEIKPNGNQLHFEYKWIHGHPRLSQVKSMNRTGQMTLNALNFNYSSEGCLVTDSYGHTVHYLQNEGPCLSTNVAWKNERDRKVLQKVESLQKGNSKYHTQKSEGMRKVVKVEKPQGRWVEVEYEEAETYREEDKVTCLLEPLGPNGEKIKSYQFNYQKNFTLVRDAHGHVKKYRFDSHQRLSSIDYLDNHHIARQETFEWSKREGEEGWLKSKSIRLGSQTFHLKSYRYDTRGNIIRASLYGNLTGEKSETFKEEEKKATDHYFIEYTYTNDARNLLKEKITPEGWKTQYEYLAGTNLCTKILHTYQGEIQERTFHTYDENGQLQSTIEDDGNTSDGFNLTQVTFRKIKTIDSIKAEGASFGKPQQVSEFYLDSIGQIQPIKRIEFFYNAQGQEVKQKVYDSQQAFCYEITKDYDTRGRLIQESNALGHLTQYEWDDHNNKTKEKLIGLKKSTRYEYDLTNRLVRKIEKHKGEVFITSYAYNTLNQLISEIDAYGHETAYAYNRFGNQIQCHKPMMLDSDGAFIRPCLTKQYNILNQVIAKTDEKGFTTHYTYNVYGSPTQITYPDGSLERLIYYPNGWLKQKWLADGTSLHYSYDPKGRLLKESTFDQQGSLLKEEEYGYKGPLLRYKKDSMGVLITYRYDGAGRKVEEKSDQGKTILYEVDDLGRVIKVQKEEQQEIYQYDGLDRLVSKALQDSQGKVYGKETYTYDIQGNQVQKAVWLSQDKIACYRFHYQSDGLLAWQEDPIGHRAHHQYNYHHVNGLEQCVQSRLRTDPLGRTILEADDVFHRLGRRDVCDNGHQVSCTRFDYDASGHLVKEHASVMAGGQLLREYWILRNYNSRGLLESETEMPQGKMMLYRYDARGRLSQKQKPDGVTLNYSSDALGRLQALASSDGTIAYLYTYDLHDNVIQVQDLVHQITQKRTYDKRDRLLVEELSPGMTLHYAYDALDRLTRLTFLDGSFVTYTYDPFHLRKIQRFNAFSQLDYEYDCTDYDLQGHLLKSRSPAGVITYTYDLMGRAIAIEAPEWDSCIEQFDPIGNLLKMKQKDPSGTLNSQFAYDRFDHVSHEASLETNQFAYDSLGNCLNKNDQLSSINALNQLTSDGEGYYSYDANGNLKTQSYPQASYTYDALNRLIGLEKEGHRTTLIYDAFGRCLQMTDASGTKQLIYLGNQEIGSVKNGQLQELRLTHPESDYDLTFAIELQGKAFFPIQDFRGNICALQRQDGSLAEWYRYTAFGSKAVLGEFQEGLFNPWRFANRREIKELSLSLHIAFTIHASCVGKQPILLDLKTV